MAKVSYLTTIALISSFVCKELNQHKIGRKKLKAVASKLPNNCSQPRNRKNILNDRRNRT